MSPSLSRKGGSLSDQAHPVAECFEGRFKGLQGLLESQRENPEVFPFGPSW
jgi:hypothetical protein